jgi:hypothetical protein
MKTKLKLISFLISLISISTLTAQTWEFDSDLDVWAVGNRGASDVTTATNCTSTWLDGSMKINITGDGAKLHTQFNPTMFSLADLNFLELSIHNESAATSQNIFFWILPADGGGAFTRAATISLTPNNTAYENIVFDLTTLNGFSNDWTIYGMRIDQSVDSGSVTYDYFRFVDSDPTDRNEIIWTLDCDQQEWGVREHGQAMTATHEYTSTSVNSGHIKMTTPAGLTQGWMFGPSEAVDANVYKYLHFSLTLDNADELPEEGLNALFVMSDAADQNLASQGFKIFKGQKKYTVDLSDHTDWIGTKYINRIHFPIKSGATYNIENAIYRLDWIAISDNANIVQPTQDTSTACIAVTPELGEIESVVFCNRVSFKTSLSGTYADATLKIWKDSEEPIEHTRIIKAPGTVYLSTSNLDINTTYNYTIELHNSEGSDISEIKQFTTEAELAEDQPMNYWMTPGPFDLIENANEHLLDNDTWTEAAALAQVYKIHGATYRGDSSPDFYSYDFPKLIYTVNKYRMRLAYEYVASSNNNGQKIADGIFSKIEEIASYGGKLEFLSWDGIFLHSYNLHQTKENFRTPDEGIEAVADAVKLIKDQYPDFELIPLPNLPNWDVTDAEGNTIPHNAGNNSAPDKANATWMELCDLFLEKMNEKGVENPINFIQIDHPFNYYTKGLETSKQRVQAIKDYCTENNLELMVIVNSSLNGMTQENTDAKFKEDCLQYLDYLRKDGIDPQYIDLESWYPYPQYLTPETKENSFSNVIRDVGKKFFFEGKIEIKTVGDVTEIIGAEETLQLNAVETDSGDPVDVNWTIDLPEIATVDSNGLVTSHQWGEVKITATSKEDTNLYATLTIKVINPDEPTAIIIKSDGDVSQIAGVGSTQQFYAENADNGEAAAVDWSIDIVQIASIDLNGLLTTKRLGTITIKAVLKSNSDVSTTFTIKIVNTLSIDIPSELKQIRLYPNPADKFVNLEIPRKIERISVKIFDVTGKSIFEKTTLQSGKLTLSTDKLSKGMYFMQIISNKGKVVRKMLINK